MRLGETALTHSSAPTKVGQTLLHGEGICGGQVTGFVRDGSTSGVKTFHVSPVPLETSEELDYTVLQVIGDANAEFGALELSSNLPRDADPLLVIGHPQGWAQRVSRESCQTDSPAVDGNRLRHVCDTMPGNSGSPVFDDDERRVIALHSAATPTSNLAVPMAKILAQSKVLKAAVPVVPAPVQPGTSELDAALALSDALTLEDRVERIAALEALLREFGTMQAAKRAKSKLEADRKQVQDDAERLNEERLARNKAVAEEEREDRAMEAYREAIREEDLTARIALLVAIGKDFAGTEAAGLAADGEASARRMQEQLAALRKPTTPAPIVNTTAYGIAASAWLSGAPGEPGAVFKECEDCPEMVVLPAGRYLRGSPDDEEGRDDDEGPVKAVRFPAPFAAGRFEVTVAEYRRFVQATGHDTGNSCWTWDSEWKNRDGKGWADPGFAQGDEHPVTCVNWEDAKAYVAWLNTVETGAAYRLLTEAEWEYAARGLGGDSTSRASSRFFWGDDADTSLGCDFANGYDATSRRVNEFGWRAFDCDDDFAQTAPVGNLKANALGLFDLSGNLWEWVQDCYADNYDSAPTNGTAVTTVDCSRRVLRGGSWGDEPRFLR